MSALLAYTLPTWLTLACPGSAVSANVDLPIQEGRGEKGGEVCLGLRNIRYGDPSPVHDGPTRRTISSTLASPSPCGPASAPSSAVVQGGSAAANGPSGRPRVRRSVRAERKAAGGPGRQGGDAGRIPTGSCEGRQVQRGCIVTCGSTPSGGAEPQEYRTQQRVLDSWRTTNYSVSSTSGRGPPPRIDIRLRAFTHQECLGRAEAQAGVEREEEVDAGVVARPACTTHTRAGKGLVTHADTGPQPRPTCKNRDTKSDLWQICLLPHLLRLRQRRMRPCRCEWRRCREQRASRIHRGPACGRSRACRVSQLRRIPA